MVEFAKNAAVLLVSIAISALGIELGVRYLGPDVLTFGNHYAFYQFDGVLGWANTPNARGTYSHSEFSYPIVNNSLGMRDGEVGPKRPGVRRVAVLGDSYTWGVGAADGERFTEVMEAVDPGLEVLNFGVSGYGTVQESLVLDRALALQPDLVLVAFCLGNDPIDNVSPFRYRYHKPTADMDEGGRIRIVGYPLFRSDSFGERLWGAGSFSRTIGIISQVLRRREEKAQMRKRGLSDTVADESQLYMPDAVLPEDVRLRKARVLDIAARLLADMRAKVDAALAPGRFAVLLVPTKFENGISRFMPPGGRPDEVADALQARLAAASVPVIDGRSVIRPEHFWREDTHWNPKGHRVIGELVARSLRTGLAGR